MIVITSLIVIDNNKFGGEVILENLAYDVALSVRQAQVYGISVQRFGSGATANFTTGYGMHFESDEPTSYVLFGDEDGTGVYNTADVSPPELVASTTLALGYAIVNLCAVGAGESTMVCGYTSIDILFKRPEPDAYMTFNGNPSFDKRTGTLIAGNLQREVDIVLLSPKGDRATTTIDAAGQIFVPQCGGPAAPCPP